MSKSAKRAQANKGRATKVIKSGNVDYVHSMQGLRRSNATAPHANKTKYVRRSRNNSTLGEQ